MANALSNNQRHELSLWAELIQLIKDLDILDPYSSGPVMYTAGVNPLYFEGKEYTATLDKYSMRVLFFGECEETGSEIPNKAKSFADTKTFLSKVISELKERKRKLVEINTKEIQADAFERAIDLEYAYVCPTCRGELDAQGWCALCCMND